jgi:hypothetical protein
MGQGFENLSQALAAQNEGEAAHPSQKPEPPPRTNLFLMVIKSIYATIFSKLRPKPSDSGKQ